MRIRDTAEALDDLLAAREARDDWRDVVAADPAFYAAADPAFRAGGTGLMLVSGGECRLVATAFHPSRGVVGRLERDGVRDALLIVHHPLVWDGAGQRFSAPAADLLAALRALRVSLYVAHDALDRSGPLSTAATFAGKVGLAGARPLEVPRRGEPFPAAMIGESPEADLAALVERLAAHYMLRPAVRCRTRSAGRVACAPGRVLDAGALDAAAEAGATTLVAGSFDARLLARPDPPVNVVAVSHYYSECDALAGLAAALEERGIPARHVGDPDARAAAAAELARAAASAAADPRALW